jgi:hypothetical protein
VEMNGLRVYIKPVSPSPAGTSTPGTSTPGAISDGGVFYSRRGNGPFYCWRYDEERGTWRVSRVTTPELKPQVLSTASWKTVPAALRLRLNEHYQE